MNIKKAKSFVQSAARPLELALYRTLMENASADAVVDALAAYQNADGGFGHGLEADYWNPNSTPIAVNDALLTLYRVGKLLPESPMVRGMVRYLNSRDGFDEEKRRWRFAVKSNADYPHAIWWEQGEGDGISGFNPTVSLAAFMARFSDSPEAYAPLVNEAFAALENGEEVNGDALKCYLLAYNLLKGTDVLDTEAAFALLQRKLHEVICADTQKYGVEYVPVPSDFFDGRNMEFIDDKLRALIAAEKNVLGGLQKEDGGFDITWQWVTPYAEFAQARAWWRPRITLDKLAFEMANP